MHTLLLLAGLATAGDQPADGKFALPQSGFTLVAPGWHMSRWSDWDFKGRSADGAIFARAWSTTYQLQIDDAVAKRLATSWKALLENEENATDVVVSEVRVEEVAGHKRARASFGFTASGGVKGVCHAAAFSTRGLTAQVWTIAVATNGPRAASRLDELVGAVEITAPPAALGGEERLTTTAGSVVLPAGWRLPLDVEAAEVAALFAKTGAKDAKVCTPAIRPGVDGQADVLLSCNEAASGGVLDEQSFPDEARLFGQRLFGRGAEKLPPAELVRRGDDVAMLLHANAGLWAGGIATEGGTEVVWVSGAAEEDEALGAAARAVLTGYELAAEKKPNPAFGALMFHRLTYQKTHPTVLGPALLGLAALVGIAMMIFRKSPHHHVDPHT